MNARMVIGRIATVLEMIKFQHSVFALPFALAAMLVAQHGMPRLWVFCWIIAACVFARSAAMAFNRLVDLSFDRANPRTRGRALVTGAVTARFTALFVVACCAGFVLSAAMLNRLALWLSPMALAVLLGYSYVKRFSDLTHFVLGVALGIAPLGAWIAVRGTLEQIAIPAVLGLGVALWTAGFDIIYACQDYDFDRVSGLRSIPRRLGIGRALLVSSAIHALAFALFIAFWFMADLSWGALTAIVATGGLLFFEHWLVSARDLSRVNAAFFTMNGAVSFVFLLGVGIDVFAQR